MFDVIGGQTLPSNFTLILYPLSRSFDEGIGRDVIAFEDIGSVNFITASASTSTVDAWAVSGANALGFVGQTNIDVVTGSTTLGDIFVTQAFTDGAEDLNMDVTSIVSATLTQQLPDFGWRISFSGTQETDDRTRFVKRFASRHSTNTRIRPQLRVGFDDSIRDNHGNFYADLSGTLFLNNIHRGQFANIVSGSALTQITGSNSLLLTLSSGSDSGSYSLVVTASQRQVSSNIVSGVYTASFAIPSNAAILSGAFRSHGSATFTEAWGSLDGTVPYFSGTLVVRSITRSSFDNVAIPPAISMNIVNLKSFYKVSERPRFRVVAQDSTAPIRYVKAPIEADSIIFDKMFYRVRDAGDGTIVFPFDTTNNATRVSTDTKGMYFEMFMSDLDIGRVYAFDFLIDEAGQQRVFEEVGGRFTVEP